MRVTSLRLKHVLSYDSDTGIFTWINPTSPRIKVNSNAGSGWKGYTRIGLDGTEYYAHQLAWFYHYGKWPKYQIDHIDGDRSNNRISNLRDVPQSENVKNSSVGKTSSSGYRGVTWCNDRLNWRVNIGINGKIKSLGRFDDLDKAISVRKEAEIKYGFHKNHGRKNNV